MTTTSRTARFRAALPDLRDLHVYGGGLVMAVGASLAWWPLGFILFGALLVYLGVKLPTRRV